MKSNFTIEFRKKYGDLQPKNISSSTKIVSKRVKAATNTTSTGKIPPKDKDKFIKFLYGKRLL